MLDSPVLCRYPTLRLTLVDCCKALRPRSTPLWVGACTVLETASTWQIPNGLACRPSPLAPCPFIQPNTRRVSLPAPASPFIPRGLPPATHSHSHSHLASPSVSISISNPSPTPTSLPSQPPQIQYIHARAPRRPAHLKTPTPPHPHHSHTEPHPPSLARTPLPSPPPSTLPPNENRDPLGRCHRPPRLVRRGERRYRPPQG